MAKPRASGGATDEILRVWLFIESTCSPEGPAGGAGNRRVAMWSLSPTATHRPLAALIAL
ncbi:hypothetical protein ACFSSA_07440 [Luteolibacter algae]|uniref:Uncharacterized protein n=1 Tax=Luteolibacter algae TaxID=454151 RepID=A0ABW5D7Y4_9BACT